VGKAAMFYRHMKMARGSAPGPNQTVSTPKTPSRRLEVVPPPKTQPEPMKTNQAQSTPVQ
jgi:hypothetical protein